MSFVSCNLDHFFPNVTETFLRKLKKNTSEKANCENVKFNIKKIPLANRSLTQALHASLLNCIEPE